MASKVKIEKKASQFHFEDVRLEGQSGELGKVFLIWQGICTGPAILLALLPQGAGLSFAVGLIVWQIVSWFIYFVIAPWSVRSRLRKHGPRIRILPNNHGDIKTLIAQYAKLVGVPEPEAFFLDEPVGKVEMLGRKNPHLLIITSKARDLLSQAEFTCAIARALAQARMRLVALPMLVAFMNETPPPLRLLVAPMWILSFLLTTNWTNMREISADRVTLLLTRNARLLSATMLKIAVAADPEATISAEDVEGYLNQQSKMQVSLVGVSTHFKLGQTIHSNPFLNERLKALVEFAASDAYKEAIAKMDAAGSRQPAAVSR
jgi:Zn-dependent protease with chaperone function